MPRDDALWFVDIAAKRVHRYHPHADRHDAWTAPEKVSFILPTRRGDFIVGLQSGLRRFDPDTGGFEHFADIEAHLPDNRLNDACIAPDGSLWFGSMHDLQTRHCGALYRVDRHAQALRLDEGYVITNGPAFSPDGRIFYHTDSLARIIYAYDCDASGCLTDKRVLVRIDESVGVPDGTTVDAEGCLWAAIWGGWAVHRYSPAGELIESVPLPCSNVTKVAFGGADRRTVYVTTAWAGLSETERSAQPQAGDLFAFRSTVSGLLPMLLEL